jgi:hypothetical protein
VSVRLVPEWRREVRLRVQAHRAHREAGASRNWARDSGDRHVSLPRLPGRPLLGEFGWRRVLAIVLLVLALYVVAAFRGGARIYEGGLPPPAGVRP